MDFNEVQEGQIFFHWEKGVADGPHLATQHSLNLETNVKKYGGTLLLVRNKCHQWKIILSFGIKGS